MKTLPISSARGRLIAASLLALFSAHCGDDSGSNGSNTNGPDSGAAASDSGAKADAASSPPIDASLHDSGTSTGALGDAATGTPADAAIGIDAASTHDDAATGDSAISADAAVTGDAAMVPDAASDTIPTLNSCAAADYADKSGASDSREIAFGGSNGLHYVPPCIIIAKGQKVTFSGSFTNHPLAPGSIGNLAAGSPSSPIVSTTTGTTAEFTFPNAGTYPYICTVHAMAQGMVGSVHVK